MKPRHPYGDVLACCVMAFVLVPCLWAQEEAVSRHTGVPQDWSQRHIVFSRDALAQHPDVIYREPRVLHQAMQRWQAPDSDVFHGARAPGRFRQRSATRDWNVNLRKAAST